MLFHTLVELFSIVVAFAVFIVAWNSRKMQDNAFLHLIGISYIFIGALDLLHTLAYKGMDVLPVEGHPANQFWVATRMLEALALLTGLLVIRRFRKLNSELIFLGFFVVSLLIILSILVWQNFPVCFIDGVGQTPFKIYSEFAIISVLLAGVVLLVYNRHYFGKTVYRLLLASMIFTVLSEACFTMYVSNTGAFNEAGHYMKLIAFFLIYKATVETGFIRPTNLIFKNLKESEQTYRTLAENLPGVVMRFDEQLRCVYSNHEVSDIYEVSSRPDKNQLITELRPALEEATRSGLPQTHSFSMMDSDLHYYTAQVIPEHVDTEQKGTFLVICQDVTDLKQTEQQLQALNDTKDKLFSIVAHDLKTPFTSLLAYSDLISQKSESLERDKIARMADRMNAAAKQASALLENLLSWSSVQTGTLKSVPVVLEVEVLLEEVNQLVSASAVAKGITIEFQTERGLLVFADHQMAATVIRNLVSNALKFSFSDSKVVISARESDGLALFSVSDEGTGIHEQHQAQLLEIGNRFSSKGTAEESGTGLGLVLCKEFVELNKGSLWFKSKVGKGTTFYFTLPLG
ncbi:MAG: histidine kinase [Sphingobacteriales bacterium]|nr:MAG: histidine kinase [Sphingobacteriales bacterium]